VSNRFENLPGHLSISFLHFTAVQLLRMAGRRSRQCGRSCPNLDICLGGKLLNLFFPRNGLFTSPKCLIPYRLGSSLPSVCMLRFAQIKSRRNVHGPSSPFPIAAGALSPEGRNRISCSLTRIPISLPPCRSLFKFFCTGTKKSPLQPTNREKASSSAKQAPAWFCAME